MTWHSEPADVVEEYLHRKLDWDALVLVAQGQDYAVRLIPRELLSSAFTDHKRRGIIIPDGDADKMHRQLLHEVAETLLRSPIAPEYCFSLSHTDEHHIVASRVHRKY